MEESRKDPQSERALLVAALKDGSLDAFLKIAGFFGDSGRGRIVTAALDAHRAGIVDLPAALAALAALPENRASLRIQRFTEHVLPGLVMECDAMLALAIAIGGDIEGSGFPGVVLNGLGTWSSASPDRPFAMLQLVRQDTALRDLMRPILLAGLRVDRARFLRILVAMIDGDSARDSSLAAEIAQFFDGFAPSDIDFLGPPLRNMLQRAQGDDAAAPLNAMVAIALRHPVHAGLGIDALERASPLNSPKLRDGVARVLMFDIAKAPDALAAAALAFMGEVRADELGAIDALDHILSHDLNGRQGIGTQVLLDGLLDKGRVTLVQLDGVAAAIVTGDADERSATVLRWLFSQSQRHVEAAADLCGRFTDEPPRFDMDFTGVSPRAASLAARRACAQLILYPVSVASILVSILRTGPVHVHPLVEALLFQPLLVNYWTSARAYLEAVGEAGPRRTANPVRQALARHDAYIAAIEAAGNLRELHPSPHRRFLAETKRHEEQVAINRAAMRQSVFADIIPTALMLYGDAAVFDVHLAPDDVRRQETEMQVHEFSQELPRLEVLDPFGSWYQRLRLLQGGDEA